MSVDVIRNFESHKESIGALKKGDFLWTNKFEIVRKVSLHRHDKDGFSVWCRDSESGRPEKYSVLTVFTTAEDAFDDLIQTHERRIASLRAEKLQLESGE